MVMVQYALQDIEALSLQDMLVFGRAALFDSSKVLTSARHAQREVMSHPHNVNSSGSGLHALRARQRILLRAAAKALGQALDGFAVFATHCGHQPAHQVRANLGLFT